MNKIPFIKEDNEVVNAIEMIIDVDSIMDYLRKAGKLTNNSLEYAKSCYDMCNVFSYIIGKELLPFCEPKSILVKEGVYAMMGNHTWIEIEGVIIDATLLQFESNANRLNFIDNSYEEYFAVRSYTFEDWVENSPNFEG